MDRHSIPALAQDSVECWVLNGETLRPPDSLPAEMQRRAAAFVSIHLKDGKLRGCIGTVQPTEENIAGEVIRNAIAAATRDPRFTPVQPN